MREQCGCTRDMITSTSVENTDCRKRVFRVEMQSGESARLRLNLTYSKPISDKTHYLNEPFIVQIEEINNRPFSLDGTILFLLLQFIMFKNCNVSFVF